jgi:cell division protease FtsH
MAKDRSHDDRQGGPPDQAPSDPWRVEGSRQTERPPPGGRSGAAATWIAIVALLALYGLMLFVFSSPTSQIRVNIPYTVFREQVQQRNVVEITATGETIQGRLRREISYPPDSTGVTSQYFKTERPMSPGSTRLPRTSRRSLIS